MVFGKSNNVLAQGTVEYLILLSVVVVIALIAVGATFLAINPVQLQEKASVESLKILDIAISETSFNNSTLEFFIKLKNNFSSRINISNIQIGDINSNFDQNMLAGSNSIFIISSSAECSNNEVLKDIVITFESKYGLTHSQKVNGVSFSCNGASLAQSLRFFYIPNEHIEEGNFFKINRLNDLNYSLNGELDNNGTPSGLVAYYKFNELIGNNVFDSSGNNNTAVFSGGPTITTDGDYTVYTYKSSGVFTITQDMNVSVLVVAGGGGGGGTIAGGGGAGGLIYNSNYSLTPGVKTVTVGSGGNGGRGWNYYPNFGSNGGNSVFDSLVAIGGGGGGYNRLPASGGSGAGGSYGPPYSTGANGTTGQGNRGGNSDSTTNVAGGGGGAGAAGANSSGVNSGDGGIGLAYDINGTLMYYAGGGGGGTRNAGTAGTGGLGGGGSGTKTSTKAGNGVANTGGGGGGAGYISGTSAYIGGDGGSGVVIIRVLTSSDSFTTSTNGLWGTNAKSFDGVSEYVSAPLVTNSIDDITLSAWFRTNAYTQAGQGIIHVGSDNAGNGYGIFVNNENTNNGNVKFLVSAEAWYDTTIEITDNQWHHVAASFSNNNLNVYVDSVNVLNTSIASPHTPTLYTQIGKNDYPNLARYFDGAIDDVAIFNRALSSEEISSIYNYSENSSYTTKSIDTKKSTSNFDSVIINPNGLKYGEEINPSVETNLSNGLVGLWHLNENALDSSGNENNGVWSGSETYSTGLWDTNSASFDESSFISKDSPSELPSGTTPSTISAWVKLNSYGLYPDERPVVAWGNVGTKQARALFASWSVNDDKVSFITYDGDVSFDYKINLNDWTNLVVVFDNVNADLYVNGIFTSRKSLTGVDTGASNFRIGSNFWSGYYFDGLIEEVAIWDRILSESEIQDLFSKNTSKFGVEARSCSSSDCSDSTSWSEKQYGTNDLKYFSFPRNKYFQIKVTPELIQFTGENVVNESCVSQYGEYYGDSCYNYLYDQSSCEAYSSHNSECYWNSYGYGTSCNPNEPWNCNSEPICAGYDDYYNSTCTGYTEEDCGNDYLCTWGWSSCYSKATYYGCSYWSGDPDNCSYSGCTPYYCNGFYDYYYYDYSWNYMGEYYYPYYYAHGSEAIEYYSNGQCYWYTEEYCDGYFYCENQLSYGGDSCNAFSGFCNYTPSSSETTYKYFINSNPKLTDINMFYQN